MRRPYSPYMVAEYMETQNSPNGRVQQEKKPKLLPKFNYYLDESYQVRLNSFSSHAASGHQW
jgi:hypothetical protein